VSIIVCGMLKEKECMYANFGNSRKCVDFKINGSPKVNVLALFNQPYFILLFSNIFKKFGYNFTIVDQ